MNTKGNKIKIVILCATILMATFALVSCEEYEAIESVNTVDNNNISADVVSFTSYAEAKNMI